MKQHDRCPRWLHRRRPAALRPTALVRASLLMGALLLAALLVLAGCSRAQPDTHGSAQQLPGVGHQNDGQHPPAPTGAATPDGQGSAPAAAPPRPAAGMRFDLIISGGKVIDGSGKPAFAFDVGISGDRITFIGNLTGYTAARRIDASGLVVAPGFINPHSHTWEDGEADAKASLLQGITTEVGGVDGRSPWPVAAYFQRVAQQGTGVNEALFVGHGTVRRQVVEMEPRLASPDEIAAMAALVDQAMREGAVGLSSGLEYRPGIYGDTAEVIALARVAAARGGLYSTHMRSEGDHLLEALDEALQIGRDAGLPVNISHFKVVFPRNWHKLPVAIGRIEAARAAGQVVFADVYPYEAPDYATRYTLATWHDRLPPERLLIKQASDAALAGRTLAEVAAGMGLPAPEAAAALLAADPNVAVVGLVVQEADIIQILQQPFAVVGTDGESAPFYTDAAAARDVHPRSYGTYPRILRWVHERQIMPLEEAVRKMSGAVADHFGFQQRGYVKNGYFADLVVFDPATVADRATFWDPQQYAAGVQYVLVNGTLTVDGGKHLAGVRPGRILRHGPQQ